MSKTSLEPRRDPFAPAPPPTADELPHTDGDPLESQRHRVQMNLLIHPLEVHWQHRDDFYVGGNMFLYFSLTQTKKNDFRGPDVMLVLDTTRRERKSWVVWEEDGRVPNVIIELTSDSTAEVDRGRKKHVYARIQVRHYAIYDPFTAEFEVNHLGDALPYETVAADADGLHAISGVDLRLGVWRGVHEGIEAPWLRWFDADGSMLPTDAERAAAAMQEAAALAVRLAEYEKKFGKI